MNQKHIWIGILALLFIGGGAYFLSAGKRVQEPILIGALLPLTGAQGSYGEDVRDGITLAEEKLRQEGVDLKAIFEDSAADPKIALSGARKLIDIDHAPVVIGGPGSSANLAVSPSFEESKTLFFPISNTAKLNDAGQYIFKLLHDVDFEMAPIAGYLKEKGLRRVSVLYDSASDSNVTGAKLFREEFLKTEGEVVAFEGFDSKTVNDFRTQLTTIKASAPDALYIITPVKSAGVAVRQARELGLTSAIFGWSGLNGSEFFTGAGSHAEGVVIIDQPFSCEGTPAAKAYCDSTVSRFGDRIPQQYGAIAYDMVRLLAAAFQKYNIEGPDIDESEKEKLVTYFTNRTFEGVSGRLSFDGNGNIREKDFVFRVAKDGRFVDVK